jgi:hypothetical protein
MGMWMRDVVTTWIEGNAVADYVTWRDGGEGVFGGLTQSTMNKLLISTS